MAVIGILGPHFYSKVALATATYPVNDDLVVLGKNGFVSPWDF